MPLLPLTFSIVMPTYRRPHTLPRAVGAVLAQTRASWELIVVQNDDGPAVELPNDERVRRFRYAERASASYARNCGLAHATGEFVLFADDDDMLLPAALEVFEYLFRLERRAKMVACGIVLPSGEPFHGFSTQSCAVRREFATPTWTDHVYAHDDVYWRSLLEVNRWSEETRTFVRVPRFVAVAFGDARGGLREGAL